MRRTDVMVVGLKLLAAYFIVTGLMSAAGSVGLCFYTVQDWEFIKLEIYRDLIRSGVSVFGGIILLILSAPLSAKDVEGSDKP